MHAHFDRLTFVVLAPSFLFTTHSFKNAILNAQKGSPKTSSEAWGSFENSARSTAAFTAYCFLSQCIRPLTTASTVSNSPPILTWLQEGHQLWLTSRATVLQDHCQHPCLEGQQPWHCFPRHSGHWMEISRLQDSWQDDTFYKRLHRKDFSKNVCH